ncbi:MAG: S41 family peptidase [Rhodospirillaceae bacterium]|nr:S41 family peptidase [Rhodospirillaceae bacterium]
MGILSVVSNFDFLAAITKLAIKRMLLMLVMGLALGACANNGASNGGYSNTGHFTPTNIHATNPHKHAGNEDVVGYFGYEEIHTLSEGIAGITERYIEDVTAQKLSINALEGLSSIDPSIDINLAGLQDGGPKRVILQMSPYDHSAFERGLPVLVDEFTLPNNADPRLWAKFVSNVVNVAKDHSPLLGESGKEKILESLFDGMLVGLDIFSRYAGPTEADHNRARREGFGGIGVHFSEEQTILGLGKKGFPITSVTKGTPADKAGFVPGDRIISVSGHNVSGYTMRKLASMLRGPIGSKIKVGILREHDNAGPIIFNLARVHIVPKTVLSDVSNGILNIRINSFNRLTAGEVRDSIIALNDKIDSGDIRGIVMDLRDNPGGLLMQSVNVADLFLTKGAIVSTNGRHHDSVHKYQAGGIDVARGLPLVILINGDSASAAEVLAGALQDQGRAVVIGTTTFGKGSVQTVLRLPNAGEITLTWSRLVTPSGYAIHQLGILPNICTNNDMSVPTLEKMAKNEALLREWREIGLDFNKKRSAIRKSCRGVAKDENIPALKNLARNVISSPELYAKAVEMTLPTDSARMADK